MTVSADEFLRRFLLHVVPGGLVRIRHFGLFANRKRRAALAHCHVLLGMEVRATTIETIGLRCPVCSGPMLIVERLTCSQLCFRPILTAPNPRRCRNDSS
jgi:hypothetical protein